jgi:hypothetical protein
MKTLTNTYHVKGLEPTGEKQILRSAQDDNVYAQHDNSLEIADRGLLDEARWKSPIGD